MGWESDKNKKGSGIPKQVEPDIHELRKVIRKLQGVETDPYAPKNSETPHSLEAKAYPDLVAKYSVFKEAVAFDTGVIYHPCGSADISPSEAFPGSRVIYADMDADAMEAVLEKGYEAHVVDVTSFNPGEVDVLILLNPQIAPDAPASFIKPGGYIVCNDYHQTARRLHEKGYKSIGIVLNTKDGITYDRETEGCWQEVDTDEELKNAPFSFSFSTVRYDDAVRMVQKFSGDKTDIAKEYKRIIAAIRSGSLAGVLELEDGHDQITLTYNGEHMMLPCRLPRKKGVADDLYVFQKTIAEK